MKIISDSCFWGKFTYVYEVSLKNSAVLKLRIFFVIILLLQLLSQKSVLLRGARTYSWRVPVLTPQESLRIRAGYKMSSATGAGIELDATGV